MTGPVLGKLLEVKRGREERPRVEGDPRTDTRAAAAHIVGVLWAAASQGLSVKDLRAAVGLGLRAGIRSVLSNPAPQWRITTDDPPSRAHDKGGR